MTEPFTLLQRVVALIDIEFPPHNPSRIAVGTKGSIMAFQPRDEDGFQWYYARFDGHPREEWPVREDEIAVVDERPLAGLGRARG